ncbi:hypothetical protein CapIbe_002488 [Capra ibex]
MESGSVPSLSTDLCNPEICIWDLSSLTLDQTHGVFTGLPGKSQHFNLNTVTRPFQMTITPKAALIDRSQANTACYLSPQ